MTTSTPTHATPTPAHLDARTGVRAALADHATPFAGQLASGIGNFAFALAAGRILGPGEFAAVAAFLAVYLLVHVPSASLGAAAALDPHRLARATRMLLASGLVLGLVTAFLAAPIGSVANLSTPMVLALAAAMPAAGLLGARRGVLYGTGGHAQVAASLAAEPAVRLLVGLPLMMLAGPVGGVAAVALGGWVALVVATRPTGLAIAAADRPAIGAATTGFTAASFLAFALIANQDLLVANAILSPGDAGGFAALSVLGSAVAFATATIPLVLLPAAATRASPDATRIAVAATAGLGLAAVAVATVVPSRVIGLGFGNDLVHTAPLLAPYLLAMTFLAVGRVLAARHCAEGRARLVALIVATGVAAHLTVLVTLTRSPGTIVATTLVATALTCVALVAIPSIDRRTVPTTTADSSWYSGRAKDALDWFARPDVAWVAVATIAALALRLFMTRGLWVDEAISVAQAQLPLGEMLQQLRESDVHPPLHHLMLWLTVRSVGSGELAVRLPSILAGAALVPVLYLLGRDLYDRTTGRVAAAAGAVAPFLVWYSQEARMYAVFMLAASLAVLAQVRVLRSGSLADWSLYVVATAAMAWSQYFAVLPIAVQQIAFLVLLWQRRNDRPAARRLAAGWLASIVALAVLIAPMAPLALDQFANYTDRRDAVGLTVAPSGHGPVDTTSTQGEMSLYAAVANGVWGVWGYHSDQAMAQIAALWPLGMLAALALLGHGRSRNTTLLLALVAVPALALFAIGTVKRDLFELRYFSGVVPLAVVLGARATTRLAATTVARAALGVLLIVTLIVGLVDQQLNGTNPRRYDFDGALAAVSLTWQPGDVLLYEPTYLAEVVDYYGPDLMSRPINAVTNPQVADAAAVYVLATERVINERETSARVGDVLARLQNDGREVVNRFERANVTVWELR